PAPSRWRVLMEDGGITGADLARREGTQAAAGERVARGTRRRLGAPARWAAGAITRLGILARIILRPLPPVTRPSGADLTSIGVVATGGICGASGLLPAADAAATLRRILPLLLFLAAIIVLAELATAAEVFDVVAARMAIIGRGGYVLLFLLCVALCS